MEENLQLRKVKAVLASDGTLKLKADTRYTGMQQDNIQGVVNELSNDRLKEYLHEELDFATCDINGFDYKENKTALPSIDESLDITVSNYATITGKRIFMLPNLMSRMQTRLTSDPGRKYDLVLGFEYKDADSMEIELPDGYLPEAMPQDVKVETRFGRYSCSVRLNGNRLFYYRSLEHYSGRFPAGDYDKLVEFYETIYRSDRNRVVLIKNE
jgi:hypothetical protein